VRELFNRLRQAMVMSENTLISVADLGLTRGAPRSFRNTSRGGARRAEPTRSRGSAAVANNYPRPRSARHHTLDEYRLLDKHGFKESQSPPTAPAIDRDAGNETRFLVLPRRSRCFASTSIDARYGFAAQQCAYDNSNCSMNKRALSEW